MKRAFLNFLAVIVFALASASPAAAQATRTWVSGVGDDANPCSRTAPCKTWAGAISKTAPGGEIDALDPAGFGAVTITKSITLDGGGGQVASVLVAGTNGVVIAAQANDVVVLRNLRFDGLLGNGSNSGNAGLSAINYLSAGTVVVDKCEIFGFNTNGIRAVLQSPSTTGQLLVSNTTINNIATAAISLSAPSGTLTATLSKLNIGPAGNGVVTKAGAYATLSDSVLSQFSGGAALFVQGGALTATRNVLSNGSWGVYATGGVARLDGNSINNSNTAVQAAGGTVATVGNNILAGNGGNLNATTFSTY